MITFLTSNPARGTYEMIAILFGFEGVDIQRLR
jgi:hypothetical protein